MSGDRVIRFATAAVAAFAAVVSYSHIYGLGRAHGQDGTTARLLPLSVDGLITKGPGSRAAGLAMAFKLIESAQDRWRVVSAPHLVALVRAGAVFVNGKLAERPGEDAPPQAT